MAGSPQWKRILISGSNLEVNELTSSTAFGVVDDTQTSKPIIFRDPSTGGFEATSSITYEQSFDIDYINVGNNSATHSVNVPDASISASVVGIPVPDTENAIYQYPVLFKNNTDDYFERTSSIYYEPYLGYFASQSALVNDQLRSGSKKEGPNPGVTAPIPEYTTPAPTSFDFPITFTGSYVYTDEDETYVHGSIGDYMEFRRAIPSGGGITSSFTLPVLAMPKGANWSGTTEFTITLRHYEVGSVLDNTGDYTDQTLNISLQDIIPSSNPQNGQVPSGFANALTASATGSFNVNGPIAVGDRFQLRYSVNETNIFHFGYRTGGGDVGTAKFIFDGETGVTGDTFAAPFSGSVIGSQYGPSGSLLNVTLNTIPVGQGLIRGDGVLLVEEDGGQTPNAQFRGLAQATASIRLKPMGVTGIGSENESGLSIEGITDSLLFSGYFDNTNPGALELTDGLAPGGVNNLSFGGTNKEQINIDFASNAGLDTINGALRVSNTLGGGDSTSTGLSASFGPNNDGTLTVDLVANSGLAFGALPGSDADALSLATDLPGFGLKYNAPNDYSSILIDYTQVLDPSVSNGINLKASTPQTLAVGNVNNPTGFSTFVRYNNNATLRNGVMDFRYGGVLGEYEIPKGITFEDNLTINGNFTVLDVDDQVTNIRTDDFETSDQFILLNSGSSTVRRRGGIIVQTSSLDSSGNASGSTVFVDWRFESSGVTIGDYGFNYAGWGLTKGYVPWDANSPYSVDNFGNTNTPTGDFTASGDYLAGISTVKTGSSSSPHTIDNTFLLDEDAITSLGAVYIDKTEDPTGADSNVYIFGVFD